MAEPAFTPSFLRRVVETERTASTTELDVLNRALARIIADPYLPEHFPTFYDPALPTFFVRADPFLIEFSINEKTDEVTFISLFYQG